MDGGYAGPKLRDALKDLGQWTVQIVKRSDTAEGFEVLPRRWVGHLVEGGEKDVHAGNELQKGVSRPRVHPLENRKTPQIKSDPKRDSPSVLSLTLHPLAGYILDDKGHSAASQGHGALNEHRECFVRWRTLGAEV